MSKASVKAASLDAKWTRYRHAARAREQSERAAAHAQDQNERAAALTSEAEFAISELEELLVRGMKATPFHWKSLHDERQFPESPPSMPRMQGRPAELPLPFEPIAQDFLPKKGILDKVFKSQWQKKEMQGMERFQSAISAWSRDCQSITQENIQRISSWMKELKDLKDQHTIAQSRWDERKNAFESEQRKHNASLVDFKKRYERHESGAIRHFVELALENMSLPSIFPDEYDVSVDGAQNVVVEFWLPAPAEIPDVKEYRAVKSRGEIEEKKLPAARVSAIFDTTLYQAALLIPAQIFAADYAGSIGTIVFNGRINSIDPATGHAVDNCIISLQTKREEIKGINFDAVDPKAAFKKLRGIAATKLHTMTPVMPILVLNKEDPRFAMAHEVLGTLDEGENLASMDWEDFEHLIREVLEQEFSSNGGEVKVTRASRDGGIDAVIFDPDPLRGGKIVVQAKRYTNTVGPSAVRDLFGTVQHEGATKGILVTTASYGPDAYDFAKGKPLTLIDGARLLWLLEKHGRKVRIDLKEAKTAAMS